MTKITDQFTKLLINSKKQSYMRNRQFLSWSRNSPHFMEPECSLPFILFKPTHCTLFKTHSHL